MNHTEAPCGRLLAVITAIEGNDIFCKYLNSERELSSYNKLNKGKGMRTILNEHTPIEWFGVEVRTSQECSGADVVYWCEPVGDSRATYRDGKTRPWQERGYRGRYVARPDVLRAAMRSETNSKGTE
jgi:hypothetical protein